MLTITVKRISKNKLVKISKIVQMVGEGVRHFGQNSQKANENRKFSIVVAK